MLQQELLIKMVKELDKLAIEYMITGSVVSSLLGEPRSTHDIDIVTVVISNDKIDELAAIFALPNYYLHPDSAKKARFDTGMFNLIDTKGGNKIDFWLLSEEEFDVSRFKRKQTIDFHGQKVNITTAEDIIIAKLRWAKMQNGSQKQMTDAIRVYELQYTKLDLPYLQYWVTKLELLGFWEELLDLANPYN
jgi:hypothetical protein